MAKINHNKVLDTIDELLTDAKNRGVIHLVTDIDKMSDRNLQISGKELLNFGTCGYLGLELDQRLKDGAIEFVQKYGTQFSVSRTYLTSGINLLLEEYLSKMYDNSPVIVYTSTSTAHISIIPTLVQYDEAVILDQQVHMSVQTAVQLLRIKGVPIEMIRHSNLEMLERQIKTLSQKHKKVWYMIDGVYSMFGDLAPMDDLLYLLDKYEALHLYIDDAHGMSWYGKNGTGYVYSKAPKHPKIILVGTLAKGFGVMGGLAVFPDEETCRKVRVFGGPLTYSHPLSPPLIGSAIASSKIHLTDEIYQLQNQLRERITYCNKLLSQTDLCVISDPLTPIYFIGMGHPKLAYEMVARLLKDGFFVSPALFPAVPIKYTGLRFTITRHIQMQDIKLLVDAMAHHYPKVLEEAGTTLQDVRKAFKISSEINSKVIDTVTEKKTTNFIIQEEKSIKNINKSEWNKLLGANGTFDWDGLLSLEDVFSNNPKPEENWDFYYFIIRDNKGIPVFATFFSAGISKDDMVALESVSLQIEEKRKKDPYYLTSKTLTMGSMLTEGCHYYLNRENANWKEAFNLLLERLSKIQESINADSLLFRDFDKDDDEFKDIFMKEGFIVINMPNTNIVYNVTWNSKEEFLETISPNSRKHLKKEVFKYEDQYEIEYKKELTKEESEYYYNLYLNVERRNRGFNMFDYPRDIINKLSKHPNWEFIILKLKPEFDPRPERKAVAAMWTYVTDTHLAPMIIGIDYNYNDEFKVYKQAVYQAIKRARILGLPKVYLGLSADIDKHKFGAIQYPKVAYYQTKDNYNMEVIESMSA
jgi:7-keto-8-aminopelargonate synthetase-like enzyme/predicted N-acyltransferase